MAQSRYGRSYWLGAARIVAGIFVAALILHLVLELFGVDDRDGTSGLIVGLFFWPVLIAYHLRWRQRTKRTLDAK